MGKDDFQIIHSDASLAADVYSMIEQIRDGVTCKIDAGMTLLYRRFGKQIQTEIPGNQRAEYGKENLATLSQELEDFARYFLLSRKFLDSLYPAAKGMRKVNPSTSAMKKLEDRFARSQSTGEYRHMLQVSRSESRGRQQQGCGTPEPHPHLLNEPMTAKIHVNDIALGAS